MSLPLRHLTRSSLNLLLAGSLLALPACSAGTTVNSPDSPTAVAQKAELAANP